MSAAVSAALVGTVSGVTLHRADEYPSVTVYHVCTELPVLASVTVVYTTTSLSYRQQNTK